MVLWFRLKQFGLGWYPASWQGWLVLVLFVCLTILDAVYFVRTVEFVEILLGLVLVLLLVCYRMGEPLGWRWGK